MLAVGITIARLTLEYQYLNVSRVLQRVFSFQNTYYIRNISQKAAGLPLKRIIYTRITHVVCENEHQLRNNSENKSGRSDSVCRVYYDGDTVLLRYEQLVVSQLNTEGRLTVSLQTLYYVLEISSLFIGDLFFRFEHL